MTTEVYPLSPALVKAIDAVTLWSLDQPDDEPKDCTCGGMQEGDYCWSSCPAYEPPRKVAWHMCRLCGYETDTARCGLPCV